LEKKNEKRTDIIKHVLSTDMEQGSSEIIVRHLHGIIEGPKGSAIRVADATKATARGGIGLEHEEGLIGSLCDGAKGLIGLDEVGGGGMVQEGVEDLLGGDVDADAVLREAVVGRVVLDGDGHEVVGEGGHEIGVDHVLGRPRAGGDVGCDETVGVVDVGVGLHGLDERAQLVHVVLRCVGQWAMSVGGIEIGFVSGLEAKKVFAYDGLTLLDDSKSPIGVVERDAWRAFRKGKKIGIVKRLTDRDTSK
jgi:hypothetical protein